jgi:CotH kinase protein
MTRFFILIVCFSMSYADLSAQNFYNTVAIRDVRLVFPNDSWDKFLDSAKVAGSESRLTGTLFLEGQKFDKVGVRYKGNSSFFGTRKRGIKKLPLNIKLAKGDLVEGKYGTLKLSNVNRDASFIREALSYEIIGTYMPAPRCNFARVYVNDKLLGIYNNVESVDENFVKNHPTLYSNTEGGNFLVKCDPEWTADNGANCPKGDKASLMYLGKDSLCYMPLYEMEMKGSWGEFINLIRILNEEPDKIERVLNIDQVLWMLALNNVLVNLDSYNGLFSHNYYLCKAADGRFTPVMWDLNLSLGGFTSSAAANMPPLSIEQLQTYQPLQDRDNPKRPLISQIFKNKSYEYVYLAHVRTILNDWFVSGKYQQRSKEILQSVDNAIADDKNKHYSTDEYRKNWTQTVGSGDSKVVGVDELMSKRTLFLKNHPLLQRVAPKIDTPTPPSVSEGKLTLKVKTTGALGVYCFMRDNVNQSFRALPMLDDGKHNDGEANDGVFGLLIDEKAAFQYYFLAGNAESASLLPERASFELLSYQK